MDLTRRSYSPGQFHFTLDNHETFMCKSFDGGLPKGNSVEEQHGTMSPMVKHLTTFEIEPMNVEVGMQDGLPLLRWISNSWSNTFTRKGGLVRLADFDMKVQREYEFRDGLITETAFPTLDAAGKEGALLKVKIQPEHALIRKGDETQIVGQSMSYQKQKIWNVSCFRLNLDGPDTSHIGKIEGFTVKQGVKSFNTGRSRFAHWEPTKLTFPDISIHCPLAHADDLIDWYNDTCMEPGNTDPDLQIDGSIEFLTPDKKNTVFTVNLFKCGVKAMTIDKSERGDGARRAKFDLYVSWMELKGGLSGSLESP